MEAWEWRDPADVVERRELQERAAAVKAAKRKPIEIRHNQRRIRSLVAAVLKKAGSK